VDEYARKSDAQTLRTPLYVVQAADVSSPPMNTDMAAKLMNKANPATTGGMHGILLVHEGMHIRLLDALDLGRGLVKDAEGEVVQVVVSPLDEEHVKVARAQGADTIYLKNLPLGFWVRMKKYQSAPFSQILEEFDASLTCDIAQDLVFIEPRTCDAFTFREYKVTRTGFQFSHGRVLTATACQGRTMHAGVIIDAGRHMEGWTKKENDDYWLDLYVMLSRATRLQDLLMMRAPPAETLLQGPPASLKKQLQKVARRTQTCRNEAMRLAHELGFEKFLHEE